MQCGSWHNNWVLSRTRVYIGVVGDDIVAVGTCSFALVFHPKMGIEKYPQYFWSRLFFINFVVQTSGIGGQ